MPQLNIASRQLWKLWTVADSVVSGRDAITIHHFFILSYSISKVTRTTKSSKNSAMTLSRINFSGYVRHMTIKLNANYCLAAFRLNALFMKYITNYCMPQSSRVTVRVTIRLSVWLVSGKEHVFILLSVVIVTLPTQPRCPLSRQNRFSDFFG